MDLDVNETVLILVFWIQIRIGKAVLGIRIWIRTWISDRYGSEEPDPEPYQTVTDNTKLPNTAQKYRNFKVWSGVVL
jgi:hypothetical protein